MKPKQDESLIHIHKSFKESAPKPFKNSKSALELVNNNITKIIEIYTNKSPEIKAKERENISFKQDQIHNLTDLKNRGRNSDILDVTNVRKEKETKRKFEHLAGNDKTHNLTLFNNSTNNLSLIKAPRFENNKLFIALGKQTLKKKKR